MNVLITGISGFVGSHFVEYLEQHHPTVKIFGLDRPTTSKHLHSGTATIYPCDLNNFSQVSAIINDVQPEKIFHLAAQSVVFNSWNSPQETLDNNIHGQLNIFEAVKKLKSATYNPKIHIACSSEEYGHIDADDLPVKETTVLRPVSPYAVSKVTQDVLGYQYAMCYGLRVVRTRAFNHSGPRRSDVFVDSNFAKQIAEIERGEKPHVLQVGNLEAVRDFTDVRDIVHAYWLATEPKIPDDVYNICSGRGYRIREILDALLKLSHVKGISIAQDPERMRPSDTPVMIGENSKFAKLTGWSPKISYLQQTLLDMLTYWRSAA